ncbi:hypothetical protein [Aeromonas jandaei]|uniref:hypothetical protein n=1 Tax=Aeromonas jandaei TaxID=650 RepID=UPI0012DE2A8E|nr:hypothetical protein [Aeromonas jandaei]
MNNKLFAIKDNLITINGKAIDLPYPVAEAITIGEIVVVRLEPAVGELCNANIYGFTVNGCFKWKVEESPHGTEPDKPFTSIYISPNGQLIAGNWNGIDYSVDVKSGAISAVAFSR